MTRHGRNVVSLTDVRLPQLRAEITDLRERLQNVTEIFNENEESFKIIADIAIALQASDTLEALDDVIGGAMIEQSADHARFYIKTPKLHGHETKNIRDLASLDPTANASISDLVATKCEACRSETYRALLDVEVEDPVSIAQIPVLHQSLSGVLIIGAEDPDFFSNNVGTLYLDFLGRTLACAANRILTTPNTYARNERFDERPS